jgi:hypothetical protein
MADSWTSVQIATLAVDALTPLTVAGLGLYVARASRRIEQIQWANQTVVTRRLDIFTQLAPGLNQLLCFATFVGGWKEIQPRQAITLKRRLDETMYANRVRHTRSGIEARTCSSWLRRRRRTARACAIHPAAAAGLRTACAISAVLTVAVAALSFTTPAPA